MSQLTSTTPAEAGHAIRSRSLVSGLVHAYLELTKARLSMLVLWTTAVGFLLATESAARFDIARFIWTLLGTAFAAGAANALNQIIEVHRDRRMHRTRNRPLPAGSISRGHALLVAMVLGIGGVAALGAFVNLLAAGLALGTILVYVAAYTPLKSRTSLNTLVGAVCGAVPPMIGWAGATGSLHAGAWALGAILFVWQIPHFLALAWLYREDYARGGYAMLPAYDPTGRLTCRIVLLTSLMLVPLALTAPMLGLAGWIFAAGSIALGLWMLYRSMRLFVHRSDSNARRVFLASIVYLSALLLLLLADRGPIASTTIHRLAARPATNLPAALVTGDFDVD